MDTGLNKQVIYVCFGLATHSLEMQMVCEHGPGDHTGTRAAGAHQ